MNRVPPTRRLSSGTLILKRVVPLLMCVALVVVSVSVWLQGDPWSAVFVLALGGVFVYVHSVLMRDVVGEVLDGGDYLLVRQAGIEESVPLTEVEEVKEPLWPLWGMPRIELVRRAPGALGRVIAFIPRSHNWIPFQESALTLELRGRARQARLGCRGERPSSSPV
jgi:hypothetical protein